MKNKSSYIKQILENYLIIKSTITIFELCKTYKVSRSTISNVIIQNPYLKKAIKKTLSVNNEILYQTLKEIFPYLIIEREYNIGSNLRLDIYIPDFKIGIEWDGEQHFNNVKFSKDDNKDSFYKILAHDDMKNKLCIEKNIILLRLNIYEHKKLIENKKDLAMLILGYIDVEKNIQQKKKQTYKQIYDKDKMKEKRAKEYRKYKQKQKILKEIENA